MIIIPPDEMSVEDIERLRANGICVVECQHPERLKFVDAGANTSIEQAAIALSRKLMKKGFWQSDDTRKTIAANFVDLLVLGTPLDPNAEARIEEERRLFEMEKEAELRRLAREEAKAEREAKKAAKAK